MLNHVFLFIFYLHSSQTIIYDFHQRFPLWKFAPILCHFCPFLFFFFFFFFFFFNPPPTTPLMQTQGKREKKCAAGAWKSVSRKEKYCEAQGHSNVLF